jgi:glucose/mannose-6-phosphate isomerase
MIDLDNRSIYDATDKSGTRLQIRGLPEQCRQAWAQASSFHPDDDYSAIDKVVVLGMGGSAIGGDFLRAITSAKSKILTIVNREYDLPQWVDEKTLVLISSYSGNTEEIISSFTQSLKTKSKKIVISTGGKISKLAMENKIPIFTVQHRSQPREALGYSFLPLLAIIQNLGLIDGVSAEVNSMVVTLDELTNQYKEDVPLANNSAKKLAIDLYDKIAVIYAAGLLTDVARRWKTQINENSKSMAFFETLPELNHNAVVGYRYPANINKNVLVLLLRCQSLHPRVLLRYQVTGELLDQNNIEHEFIDNNGGNILADMMSAVLMGDWVSYYLAILNGIDPTPVPEIDFLKKRLAETK